MSEYTPAPWTFRQSEFSRGNSVPMIGYQILTPHPEYGELVLAEIQPMPYPVAVSEENARLMAAAPELLKALEDMLDPIYQSDGRVDCFRQENAANAIAKALGKSPAAGEKED